MPTLELDDIQGIVARGYGDLEAATYVLLAIDDPTSARRWIGSLADQVTPGSERPSDTAVNTALTANGLARLGLPASVVEQFSNELVAGMTTPHRQRILGDVDESAPENWLWGGPRTPAVDLLLLLFATNQARLDQLVESYAAAYGANGLREIARLDTVALDDHEHFGFKDGVSQPFIEGLPRTGPAWNTIKSGEFLLGYQNEYDKYTDRPLLPPSADPRGLLPAAEDAPNSRDLGRNGSYLVFRHLRQDVAAFWEEIGRAAAGQTGDADPEAEIRLAAKMVGRWPSGAPLALAPTQDDPALADANDFGYGRDDPGGLRCPVGAHVRRANPRDALDPDPGSDKSIAINKRHRILRRGRKYGAPPRTAAAQRALVSEAGRPAVESERGLYFIGLNANIARQFEFIQHTWLNNPKFDGLYDDIDPLVGAQAEESGTFTVQAAPVRRRVSGLPRFVHVRGGAYFFLPGIRALRYLASLP